LSGSAACLAFGLYCSAVQFSSAQQLPSLDGIAGKALFEKNWVSAPASTAASDGLGPFFNARSCAACHPDGGRGNSAEMLTFVTNDPVYGEFLQTHAIQGLRAEGQASMVFRTQISRLPDGTEVVLRTPLYEIYDLQYGPIRQQLSARVAPSLSGVGLLEQVPEEYLELLADPDDANGDNISGRVSKVPQAESGEPAIGRFGWKAQTASLENQIAKAFSLDMGLGTTAFQSAFGDCTEHQSACLQQASGNSPATTDPEVPPIVLELVVTYLKELGSAGRKEGSNLRSSSGTDFDTAADRAGYGLPDTVPGSGTGAEQALAPTGYDLFDRIGCDACHLRSVPAGAVLISPFTDLLLHDMGPGLAAEATDSAGAAEWRTAPLWGLSSVRSYLHDGRATTLAEAILWHGGEAASAVNAWSALTAAEREVLHNWLHSL